MLFFVGEVFVFAINVPVTLRLPTIPYILSEEVRDAYFSVDLFHLNKAFFRTRTRQLHFDFSNPTWTDAYEILESYVVNVAACSGIQVMPIALVYMTLLRLLGGESVLFYSIKTDVVC